VKISIIGAGSGFTRNIAVDLLNIPSEGECTLALVDIDANRLELARRYVERVIGLMGSRWKLLASTRIKEVIGGSDFIINQAEMAGERTVANEIGIPHKYGVFASVGDTTGPGGLFKILRNVPMLEGIVAAVEECCPDALILSYTNPMSAMTLALSRLTRKPVVGLCHSVQGTSRQLADYIGVPYDELVWNCAGINHMSWVTKLEHKGVDQYPRLKEKVRADPDLMARDHVRFDAMLQLGYFVTESSFHFSEYVPYYRKRQDLILRYCPDGKKKRDVHAELRSWTDQRLAADEEMRRLICGEDPIRLESSNEYAAVIIDSIVNDRRVVVHVNVPNRGLVENLRPDGIVEVACLVDRHGVRPCRYGPLPAHLAALNRSNMDFFDLAVTAALEHDREAAIHALMLDPLTSAVCSLSEIRAMFDEIYEADREYIPEMPQP
jgi:alpha-galactosidase